MSKFIKNGRRGDDFYKIKDDFSNFSGLDSTFNPSTFPIEPGLYIIFSQLMIDQCQTLILKKKTNFQNEAQGNSTQYFDVRTLEKKIIK